MRVLSINCPQDLKQVMQELKVDPYGIKIMWPKSFVYLVKINSLAAIAANILKQQMLSLGGDVALPRDALTGKLKQSDCLLIGNLAQYHRLNNKLKAQPFGLNKLAAELSKGLAYYQKDNFVLKAGKYRLNLKRRPHIMGVLNLTPDSFSGDGLYKYQISKNQDYIIEYAQKLAQTGADILDLGGESSRPQAKPVSLKEELNRTIPVIKKLAKRLDIPISIDTYKPEVAKQALDNGAVILNDITGLENSRMRKIAAQYKAAVIIMHMQGLPRNMQNNPLYQSPVDEIIAFLAKQIESAQEAGIDRDKIVVDPGIGFGKTLAHNLEILKKLCEFKILGRPILIGPSRKSFIGKILNIGPEKRLNGTLSACILAVKGGAHILRVHDVSPVYESLKVAQAILN